MATFHTLARVASMVQWGVVRRDGGPPRAVARVGERVVPLAELGIPEAPVLNPFIELGRDVWRDVAARAEQADGEPLDGCEAVMPVRIPDYVDFYASLEHVENFGDGLTVNLTTSGGQLIATASIDNSGFKSEGTEIVGEVLAMRHKSIPENGLIKL